MGTSSYIWGWLPELIMVTEKTYKGKTGITHEDIFVSWLFVIC